MLNENSLATFGGSSGLRDEGLLDSAVARPQNTQAYTAERTMANLVASYAFDPAKNQAFVNGNKHAVFLSNDVFLSSSPASYATETIFVVTAREAG